MGVRFPPRPLQFFENNLPRLEDVLHTSSPAGFGGYWNVLVKYWNAGSRTISYRNGAAGYRTAPDPHFHAGCQMAGASRPGGKTYVYIPFPRANSLDHVNSTVGGMVQVDDRDPTQGTV